MIMYNNHNRSFEPSHSSSPSSFADSPFDSSFSSMSSSDGSSVSWAEDSDILTPVSTPRRTSMDFGAGVKIDSSSPTSSYTQHTYDHTDNLSPMSCLSQADMMLALTNNARMGLNHINIGNFANQAQLTGQSIEYYGDSTSDCSNLCFEVNQEHLRTSGLKHQQQAYSNIAEQCSTASSSIDGNFVIPSQTFHDDFGNFQSQMHITLGFESYDSPATSFDTDLPDYSKNTMSCNIPASESRDSSRWLRSCTTAEPSATTTSKLRSQPTRQTTRQPNYDLRSTTMALQHMQLSSAGLNGAGARRTKKDIKREQHEMCRGINASIQKEAEERCNWKDCKAKFHRREHLKRHQKCHMQLPPQFFCNFCDKPRAFSRTDNLKSHVKLHIKHRASARTPYHPDALAFYEGLNCKARKNKSISELDHQIKRDVKREAAF